MKYTTPNTKNQQVDLPTGGEEDAAETGGEDEEDEERDHGRSQHLLHLDHDYD